MKKSLLLAFTFLYALPVHASVQDLIDSIKNKDLAQAETLLKNGENVNAANEQGNTPLHYAVATNNADMARLLLQYGADMNAENTKGWSPLKIAQTKNVAEVTEVLVEKLKQPAVAEVKAVKETAQKVTQNVAQNVAQNAAPKVNAAVKTVETKAAKEIDDAAEDAALLDDAMQAVEQARQEAKNSEAARLAAVEIKNKAEAALTEAEEKIADLEQKNKDLEKTVADQKKELTAAAEKLKAAQTATATTAAKAASKAPAPAAKTAPKAVTKAAAPVKKAEPKAAPAPKPQPPVKSKLNSAMTAGDEEVIYCLNILGQVENPNMVQAAGFYASGAGISHARYNEIAALANGFYSGAKEAELKSATDQCGKIITPANAQKQNQIIRSLNMARGQ